MEPDERINICKVIAEDAKNDAINFEGKPFNGKTVAEYLGHLGAATAALANLIKSILEEKANSKN
jgi:hypothetical protein